MRLISADMPFKVKNAENAQHVIKKAVALLAAEQPESIAHTALAQALVTPIDAMDKEVKAKQCTIVALQMVRFTKKAIKVI
jgi:5'-methylthioadenosine phosphorylase